MRAVLLCLLLLTTPTLAETISFKPGEISASVKGSLVADATKEYIFHGQAGQKLEFMASSERGQWLVIRVRSKDKADVFYNFESGHLKGTAILPSDGDYTVYLALRRAEAQREGRVDYALTLTLHPKPTAVAIERGRGEYFVNDEMGRRPLSGVSVGLGSGGDVVVEISLGEDGFTVKGTWRAQTDEALLLDLTEAFGQKVRGRGILLLDDEVSDKGDPTHIFLQFDAPEQKTHHTLFYEES